MNYEKEGYKYRNVVFSFTCMLLFVIRVIWVRTTKPTTN